jgi:hypothetical protein
LIFLVLFLSSGGFSQLSGIKTIPGTYPTFAAAVAALNGQGVAIGGVEFQIAAGYVEQNVQNIIINPTTNRPSSLRPVIFKKQGVGNNPLFVSGTGTSQFSDVMIKLLGVEYVTFDGISLQENPSNSSPSTYVEVGFLFDVASPVINVVVGCKYNTIKNCHVAMHRANSQSVGIKMNLAGNWGGANYNQPRLGHSYNQFLSNTIEDVARGYLFQSAAGTLQNALCVGNRIDKDPGSGKPSLITNFSAVQLYSCGIEIAGMDQTTIANTRIDSRGNTPTNRNLFGIKIGGEIGYSTEIVNDTITVQGGGQVDSVVAIVHKASGASNGSFIHVHDNLITACRHYTSTSLMSFGGSISKLLIEENRVIHNGDSINGNGGTTAIDVSGFVDEIQILDNLIEGNYFSYAFSGISLKARFGFADVVDNIIDHNHPIFPGGGSFTGIELSDITMFYNHPKARFVRNRIANSGSCSSLYGLRLMHGSSNLGGEVLLDSNQIYNLTGGNITGIYLGKIPVVEASRNEIHDLVGNGEISGISADGNGDYLIHDNYITGLNGYTTSAVNTLWGIFLNGGPGMTTKIYQNTVYINSPSSGLPFQSAAIRYWGTATDHYLSGNILVNLSNPVSSPGFTNVIYVTNSSPLQLHPQSGGNCLYVGPTGPYTRLLSVSNGSAYTTMDQYRSIMSPAEQNSFSELPPFVNATVLPYDLHLLTTVPTRCEQGSFNRSRSGIDLDGNIRQGYPGYVLPMSGGSACDVGADEFGGIPFNGTPPRIQYEPLTIGLVGTARVLTNWATIEDAEGIDTSPGNLPRLYYKRSTDQDTLAGNTSLSPGWKYVEATVSGNKFSFTVDYTRLLGGSVTAGTVIRYFIVAQDLGSPRIVSTNRVTLATAPGSVQLLNSNFPAGGQIRSFTLSSNSLSGTILVGAGQTYTSLTNPGGAFALINASVLTGDVEIKVTSDLVNELGAVDLNPWPEEVMRGMYHVRISPDAPIMRLIEGTDFTNALLRFDHVDRVMLDGMVNGQRGHLLIRNKGWTQPAIHILNGAQDIHVSGCIVENVDLGITSQQRSVGIAIDQNETPTSLEERGCDGVCIDQNEFRMRTDTIVPNGSAIPAIEVIGNLNEGYDHDSILITNNYFSSLQYPLYGSDLSVVDVRARCDGMRIDSNHFFFPHPNLSVEVDQLQFISYNVSGGTLRGKLHIGGNYIGGSQPFCQGAIMPTYNLNCSYFQGIGVSYPGSHVTIEDNHFQNVKFNFTDFGSITMPNLPSFAFIQGRWGDFSIKNNQIGASGATGNVKIKWNTVYENKRMQGIVLGDSTSAGTSGVIENNHLMNIEAYDSTPGVWVINGGWISAYSRWHEGVMTIRNNQIGDTIGANAVSLLGVIPNLFGVHIGSRTCKIRVSDNLIGNLHTGNFYSRNPFVISAGLASGSCGTVEVTGNYIENSGQVNPFFTPGISRSGFPSSICVYSGGKDNLVAGNHIRLSTRDSQGRQQGTMVTGILIQTPLIGSGKVFGNTIDAAGLRFGQANATFAGIKLKSANDWTVHSNSILVGDSGTLHPTMVSGILDSAWTGENQITNNTVLLAASLGSSGATASYNKIGKALSILRNNLLVNAIPAGTAGADYAISVALDDLGPTWNSYSSNYNLFLTGDSTRVAKLGNGGNPLGFAAWKASAMCDRESYAVTTTTLPLSVLFENYLAKDLHINPDSQSCWYVNGKGIAGEESGFEVNDMDFDSARATTLGIPVDIGADEFSPGVGVLPLSCQASGPVVAGTTTSYKFAGRTIGEITWPMNVNVPQNVDWKYYSSVPPIGSGGQDINSYWKLDFGGSMGWSCGIRYYYSIHEQAGLADQSLNLGQRVAQDPWYYLLGAIGQNARGKFFDKPGLNTIDEFTLGIQAPSNPFLITTTVTSGQGSALPSNLVAVAPFDNQTLSFVGNGCYWVDSVFVDGNYVGNPSTYTFTSVQSNHQVEVKFLHALLPPVVTISQTSGGYCPTTTIGLTATTFLGGPAPIFQWYVNNLPAGTNSTVLTGSFQNGDIVKCVMTSNDTCAIWPIDTSNIYIVSQVDSVPPTATCNTYQLQLGPLGPATLLTQNVAAGSFDLCGIASTTLSQTTFDCSDVGIQNVIVTVQDSSGNSSTCTAAVTVLANPLSASVTPVTNVCGRHISCSGGQDGTATAQAVGGCSPYNYQWSNGATTQTVSNLSAGILTVTVVDAVGGTTTASALLVQPVPLFLFLTSVDSSCIGDSTGNIVAYINHGNNCQPYSTQWTFPNGSQSAQQSLTGIGPGNYDLLVTDVLGCTDSMTVHVGSLPTPQPTISQNGNVLSTAPGFASYQWLLLGVPIPGATGSSHTAAGPGQYQVEVTGTNGCFGISSIFLLVGSPDPFFTLNGLELYPNPANGSVRLSALEGINGKVNVQIRNQMGQLVRTFELPNLLSPQELNISGLSAGCYFLHVEDAKLRTQVLKLDIQ